MNNLSDLKQLLSLEKIKDNNFSYKKLNNVVVTGGGSQLDHIESYVSTIFASSTRIANPISELNLQKDFKKPNYCDVIGSILYDPNLYKINFIEKQSISKKKQGISGFFTWLDQYI